MDNIENIDLNNEISTSLKTLLIQEFEKSSYIHLNDFFASLLHTNISKKKFSGIEENDIINNLDISVKKKIIRAYNKSSEKKISIFLLKCIKNVPIQFREKIKVNPLQKLKFIKIKSYSTQIIILLRQIGVENEEIDNFLKEIIQDCTSSIRSS